MSVLKYKKLGDTTWKTLPSTTTGSINVVQTKGESTKDVMSQKAVTDAVTAHTADTTVHVTSSEKSTWNGKADASTTLAGYGITNAYTKTEIDTMIGNIETLLAAI